MKITYLKLKNFAAIDAALHMKKLEIDFTKMINSILLFIGPIGSCKTYIMSQLQPFAHMGNVDIRHGEDMIIPEKDGEKEIHFLKPNGDRYIIHHFYLWKKNGRIIRSFISKNGIEMNSSGLVTSFNNLVEIEFGIDIGFLRILRLGTNVNNLVNLTSTNRKDFAVKLLSEVDEYVQDYKNAVITSREYSSELSLIVDKLKRFGKDDSTENKYKDELWRIEQLLDKYKKSSESATQELYKARGKMESEVNGSIDDLRSTISKINNDIMELIDANKYLDTQINNIPFLFVFIEPADVTLEKRLQTKIELEKEIAGITAKIEVFSQNLFDMKNTSQDLENQAKSIQELSDTTEIMRDINSAKEFDEQYSKYYDTFEPKCTKQELLEDIALMQLILDKINITREFSKEARDIYVNAYNKGKDPREVCINKMIKLSAELDLSTNEKKIDKTEFIIPEGCTQAISCPFYNAFKERKFRSTEEIKKDIEIVREAIAVCDCVYNIQILLNSRKDKFPYKVLMNNIILDILNGTLTFFNFEEASKMVTFLEKFDEWKENKEHIKKLQSELEILELKRNGQDTSIFERRKEILIQISDTEKILDKLRKEKKELKKELDILEESIENLKLLIALTNRKNENIENLHILESQLKALDSKIKLLQEFDKNEKALNDIIDDAKFQIVQLEQSHFQVKVKLMEFQQLREKKAMLEKDYAKAGLVRNAVSSDKGIPLLYLNAHFGRARNIANRVIEDVCGNNSIQLEMMVINEKEFRIPYRKNGVLISDIIKSSQGETSIASMAISFGLLEEFVGAEGYNIPLMDEVDGPLDIEIKASLLRMLEKRMQAIHSEQLFMITHSPLFENYPVDVFVTIDREGLLDGYKNINRIN